MITLKPALTTVSLTQALYGRTAGQERMTSWLVAQLLRLDAQPAAAALLRMARRRLEGRPLVLEELPVANPGLPAGPVRFPEPNLECSLLVFPPAGLSDRLVDQATGGYGYAWLAVDLGEVDAPSGRRVMLELPFFTSPRHVFLDRYGEHPYARIPLAEAGVDCQAFAACVRDSLRSDSGLSPEASLSVRAGLRIAEQDKPTSPIPASHPLASDPGPNASPQDRAPASAPLNGGPDASSLEGEPVWNSAADPARLFSSRLLAASLPAELLAAILQERQAGLLSQAASAAPPAPNPRAGRAQPVYFVSPNAFCEYFGAPRGSDLVGPGQRIYPARGLQQSSRAPRILGERRRRKALLGLSLAGGLLLGGALAGRRARLRRLAPPGPSPQPDPEH